jgi:hypothetical protein
MKLKGGALLSLSLSLSLSLRKSIIRLILVLLIFGAFFTISSFVPPVEKVHAVGNTYYVRNDGGVSCANKANATNPAAAATSLNMSQVNACTFSAGDSVLFSSQGSSYATALIIPSGGSVGNKINYTNVLGETPQITASASPMIVAGIP